MPFDLTEPPPPRHFWRGLTFLRKRAQRHWTPRLRQQHIGCITSTSKRGFDEMSWHTVPISEASRPAGLRVRAWTRL